MTASQKQLFLDLAALSEEQIEVGLQAGVWGDPARPVVERVPRPDETRSGGSGRCGAIGCGPGGRGRGQSYEGVGDLRPHNRRWCNAGSDGVSVRRIPCPATGDDLLVTLFSVRSRSTGARVGLDRLSFAQIQARCASRATANRLGKW